MKIIKGLVYTDKQYIEILEKRIDKVIKILESKGVRYECKRNV